MNKQGNLKAQVNGILQCLTSYLVLSVFADEGNPDPTPPINTPSNSGSSLNYEELIKMARQEEKDKLYGQINTLKEKVNLLTESNNEALLKCAEWKNKYEGEIAKQNNGEKSEEVTQLETKIEELNQQIEELKNNTPDEKALREKIEAEFTVKNHLSTIKEKNKDKVLAVFIDEITGNTVDEINASLEKAIAKSESVREQVIGSKTPSTEEPKPQQNNGSQPQVPPTANPSGNGTMPQNFDPEYVRKLQPGTPEYAEFRKSLGLK